MRRRSWLWTNVVAVAGIAALAGAAALGATAVSGSPDEPTGDILLANATNSIPDSYVVVFKHPKVSAAKVDTTARDLTTQFGGQLGFTYTRALRGFSVTMPTDQARKLAKHSSVAYVQQNLRMRKSGGGQQDSPPWGLDRIDQRERTLDKAYRYPTAAADVTAYVIDSGLRITHTEFAGRASHGWDFVDNDANADDCDGHGTHVAGTVAGSTTYSVAKEAKVVGVRVLGCDGFGTTAAIVSGINWVAENAKAPAVANMSIGGGANPAIDEAVNNAIAAGVTFVVAAGNEKTDACNSSPARVPAAITVGATGKSDARASFSNYGTCVDIFAPGEEILSLGITDDKATATAQGTSMASPHVAGAVALLLAQNPNATPEQLAKTLTGAATTDKVTGPGTGSPNKLLYTGSGQTRTLDCQSGGAASSGGGQPGAGMPGFGLPGTKPSASASKAPDARFTCTLASDTRSTTITWRVNDKPMPEWDGEQQVSGPCTIGRSYTVRIDVANADPATTTVTCAAPGR